MDTHDCDLVFWIWLSQINGIGPVTAKILLNVFKTPENIYKATKSELVNIQDVGNITADAIFNSKSLVCAEEILSKCEKLNISILTHVDSLYPIEVRHIKNAPVILYYKGNIIQDSVGVSIVGSRRCSEYNYFPMRNRLISAWCKKLLVVEAGEKSGALLTATYAKDQNRQVFAVPNSIYSRESIGANKLIEEGAKIYLNPTQLLLNNISNSRINDKNENIPQEGYDLTALEKVILTKIKDNPMTLGELSIVLCEDISDILETISIMELMGKLINVGGIFRTKVTATCRNRVGGT